MVLGLNGVLMKLFASAVPVPSYGFTVTTTLAQFFSARTRRADLLSEEIVSTPIDLLRRVNPASWQCFYEKLKKLSA